MAVFDTRRDACESAEMKTARNTLLAVALAVVGCGGAKSDPGGPLESARDGQKHEIGHREPGKGEPGKAEHDEMAMPAPIKAFHDVLAPRWHAARGPQRMADTCAALGEFHGDADAIAAAPAPQGRDAAVWSAAGVQLVDAVGRLDTACKAHDAAGFETAFAQVHERFHAAMEAGAGEHGEPH
jgi:hypothetical protein